MGEEEEEGAVHLVAYLSRCDRSATVSFSLLNVISSYYHFLFLFHIPFSLFYSFICFFFYPLSFCICGCFSLFISLFFFFMMMKAEKENDNHNQMKCINDDNV